ncbi:MAG: hemolysin family protein [Bacteroidota bacterium]
MEILIAVLMLSLSFFFSGMEIAFYSSSRLKIELKTVQGNRAATILSNFIKKRGSEAIITILIGNNIALVIFTLMMENIVGPWLTESLGLNPDADNISNILYTLAQALLTLPIILVLAEYIPKAIFKSNSDRIVFPAAHILNFFYYILRPLVWAVNKFTQFFQRLVFPSGEQDDGLNLGKKDLDLYIQDVIVTGDTPVEDLDTEMLTNALQFSETKARECMIPRTEIEAVSVDISLEELMERFIETRHSKLLVYDDSLDEVKGFIHSNHMFTNPASVKELIQPVLVVPESMSASMLMAELTENQRSVALVVDEFGGTAGMITIEDLIEEVFGEIEDEHDTEKEEPVEEDLVKQVLGENAYMLGARLEIDDINEEFGLELPEEEYYTTLGGLIMYVHEDIPAKGENILIGQYRVNIVKATPTRVIAVKLDNRPL